MPLDSMDTVASIVCVSLRLCVNEALKWKKFGAHGIMYLITTLQSKDVPILWHGAGGPASAAAGGGR
jgi:hypothetical protein